MKKTIVLLGLWCLFLLPGLAEQPVSLQQEDPQDETVADSVSIDDAAPIFYDAEEEMEEEIKPEKEQNPLSWALYLGGAALIIVIITVIVRRRKSAPDENE